MEKILLLTPIIEYPPDSGPSLRIDSTIKALSKICEVYIIAWPFYQPKNSALIMKYYLNFAKEFKYIPTSKLTGQNILLRAIKRVFHILLDLDIHLIIDTIEKNNISVVWFGHGQISLPFIHKIKRRKPDLKLICDTDSIWSRFILRSMEYTDDPQKKQIISKEGLAKEEEEKEFCQLCDVVTAVSEVDAKYYRALVGDKGKIHIFSNGVDLNNYNFSSSKPKNMHTPAIYFAGSFGPDSPTDIAIRWFIKDVYPSVLNKIKDVHLYIIGIGSAETLKDIKHPNITVVGKLPSVLPYLRRSDVAIVPLKFESGTRFKILEAGVCGIPIITTSLGVEGLPLLHNKHLIVADTTDDFAKGVIHLLKNRKFANQLAVKCKELIKKYYLVDSVSQEAKEILQYICHI